MQSADDGVKVKRRRRTKLQMEAARRAEQEAKQAFELKRVSNIQAIAALENKMVDEDANDVTPRPATRQDRNLRRTYATLALYEDEEETGEEALGGANPDELTEPPTDKEEPLKKKSKKEPKPKARTEIMTARQVSATSCGKCL
jgi:hypothetical protein